jgi:hypothetical protein
VWSIDTPHLSLAAVEGGEKLISLDLSLSLPLFPATYRSRPGRQEFGSCLHPLELREELLTLSFKISIFPVFRSADCLLDRAVDIMEEETS